MAKKNRKQNLKALVEEVRFKHPEWDKQKPIPVRNWTDEEIKKTFSTKIRSETLNKILY